MNNSKIDVSIIVPVFNEEHGVAEFLRQLRACLADADNIELLVVDGGSSDRTVAVVNASGIDCLHGPKGRARQMNFGAAQACGDYLLFLHCDTALPAPFASVLHAVFNARPRWGFFRLRLTGRGMVFRVIERAISSRSALSGIGTGDQAIFVRRDVWQQVNGYRDLALMEDVDLCSRLRRAARPQVLPQAVVTSSRRWEQRGVTKTIALMWFLRACFYLGVSDKTLARWYR